MLREAAKHLKNCVQSSALLARLSGDEFLVLEPTDGSEESVAARCVAFLNALNGSHSIDGRVCSITCRIGAAVSSKSDNSYSLLFKQADLARLVAKQSGEHGFCIFNPALHSASERRKIIEDELRVMVADGMNGFNLVYQPIFSAKMGRLTGAEALLRWTSPTLGPIGPDEFIKIAEQCGVMDAIGNWVLDKAIGAASHWPSHMRVAVNVSAKQLENELFVEKSCRYFGQIQLPAVEA